MNTEPFVTTELRDPAVPAFSSGEDGDIFDREGNIIQAARLIPENPEEAQRIFHLAFESVFHLWPSYLNSRGDEIKNK